MFSSLSEKTLKFLENTCIFCQPWWLEAVSPGQWDMAVVERGDEVAAVMPYVYKIRLGKYRLLELPYLTFYLGPWLRENHGKYANKLGEEKDLMTELIEKLPQFASFQQWFHPSMTNWLPFYWKGFGQTTRYTYVIEETHNLDAVWNGTRENIRTDIRKARKHVEIIESQDFEKFLEQQRATFARQGKPLPYPEEVFRRLDSECAMRGARKILLARDSQDRIHASVYLVWDSATVYALLRGSDLVLRTSGATSFLMWKAIEFASSQNKRFDFAGSWNESIERFVRAFGGRQAPFFEISRMNSKFVQSYRALWRWTHRSGGRGRDEPATITDKGS